MREQTTQTKKQESKVQPSREHIAVAAYYNAERRGFEGNAELDDWLQAERTLASQAGGEGVAAQAAQIQLAETEVKDETADNATQDEIESDRIQEWANKLNVSPGDLRTAIQRVGTKVSDVKHYIERELGTAQNV